MLFARAIHKVRVFFSPKVTDLESLARRLGRVISALSVLIIAVMVALPSVVYEVTQNNRRGIDTLACYLIAQVPNNVAPIIPEFRHKYHCPAYGKDPNLKKYPPVPAVRTGTTRPTPTVTVTITKGK